MDVKAVTKEDGISCILLIEFLKKGRWDLSGEEAEKLIKTKQWVQALGVKLGAELKSASSSPQQPVQSGSMRVKQIGSLAPAKGRKKAK